MNIQSWHIFREFVIAFSAICSVSTTLPRKKKETEESLAQCWTGNLPTKPEHWSHDHMLIRNRLPFCPQLLFSLDESSFHVLTPKSKVQPSRSKVGRGYIMGHLRWLRTTTRQCDGQVWTNNYAIESESDLRTNTPNMALSFSLKVNLHTELVTTERNSSATMLHC